MGKKAEKTVVSAAKTKVAVKSSAPVKKAPVKPAAKKAEAKPVAKKAAPAKPAVKKAEVKKAPAKKVEVKKAAPVKKAEVKKAPAKKAEVKKVAPVKKAEVKKAPAKKVEVKKTAPVKKAEVKKAPAKKADVLEKPMGRPNKKLKLSKAKQKHYTALLMELRASFTDQLQFHQDDALYSKKDSAGERAGMATHMADLGSDNFRHDIELALLSEEGDVLEMIDESLQRIEDQEYGICVECGCEINPERLEAKPYARYCVRCKDALEKLEDPHRRHR